MIELVPGHTLRLYDRTPNHWIGHCGPIMVVVLFDGASDDVSHVSVGQRLSRRLAREFAPKLRLLAVLPPTNARAPSAPLREALIAAARQSHALFDRVSLCVESTGFLGAIHRGAATTILTLARPSVPFRVVGTVQEGARFLAPEHPDLALALARACADVAASMHEPGGHAEAPG